MNRRYERHFTKLEDARVLMEVFPDDHSPNHVLGCHGFPLDWLADPGLPLR